MTHWLPDIDERDVAHIRLVGVAVAGVHAGVERAVLALRLWDGRVIHRERDFGGIAYETLTGWIESFNRSRRGDGTGGAGRRWE